MAEATAHSVRTWINEIQEISQECWMFIDGEKEIECFFCGVSMHMYVNPHPHIALEILKNYFNMHFKDEFIRFKHLHSKNTNFSEQIVHNL